MLLLHDRTISNNDGIKNFFHDVNADTFDSELHLSVNGYDSKNADKFEINDSSSVQPLHLYP